MIDAYDSERAVIGSCCLWPERIASVDLAPEDFGDPRCAAAFRAALDDPDHFDIVAAGALPEVGGAFIRSCADLAVTVHELDGHVRRVREASRQRRIRAGVEDTLRESSDAAEMTVRLEELCRSVMQESDAPDTLSDVLVRLNRRWDEKPARIPTGFKRLDGLLGGLRPGQYVIVAARPSVGKSAFALQVAASMARAGKRVLVFTLEMAAEEQAARLLAMEGCLPLSAVTDGRFADTDERVRAAEVSARIAAWPIRLDDRTDVTADQIRRRVRVERPDAVIVDYIGLIRTPGRANKNDELAAVSRSLKLMAAQEHVPVIALSQLNRAAGPEERPALSALRDSGSLEQDADAVILLWRPAPGQVTVTLAKHRQGATGEIACRFLADTVTFREEPAGPGWAS